MNKPIFTSVHLNLNGSDGNALVIVGTVLDCLRKAGYSKNELDELRNDMISGDYEHLCNIARKHIYLDK
jgi:hypothetical protein